MKHKGKRLIAILLAAVMVCALLAGCAQDGDNTEDSHGSTVAPRPTVGNLEDFRNTDIYPLEGEHTLSMGIALENAQDAYLMKLMSDAVGVNINYRYLTDEQAPLLFVDMEQMPDMLYSAAGTFGLTLQRINGYGKNGALINYMDYLDKMPNLSKAYLEHPNLFDGVMNAEGEVYTLPYYVYTLTGCANLVYFRGDHLAAVGRDKQPATVDELTGLLRDLKAHYGPTDPKYIPMTVYEAGHANFNNRLTQWLFPAFGKEIDPGIHIGTDGKAIAGFATEQYKLMTLYIRQLVVDGLLDSEMYTAKSSLMQAFMMENHTSVNTRMLNLPDSSFDGGEENILISQPLTSQYTDTPVFAEPTVCRKWGGMISSACSDLDAALAYMDAFFAPKENPLNEEGTIYNLSAWLGEEGVDWEWVEEGLTYKESDRPDDWAAKNGFSGAPYIGVFHAMRLDSDGKPEALPYGLYNNCLPYAVSVIRDSALALTEDENEVYLDKWQDVYAYVSSAFASFVTGNKDIESEWDAYVAALEGMGLQEILDCYDAAYARYNAK